MDIKTIIKENLIQLLVIFAVFLFMIIFSCTWASSSVRQYMATNAEEMLMVAEERIQSNLRESEVTLLSVSATLIQKHVLQGQNPDTEDVQEYLSSLNDIFVANANYALGYQDIFWFLPGDDGGILFSGSSWARSPDFVPESRSWYLMASAVPGEVIITAPYYDLKSQREVITIATMLLGEGGNRHGFLGIDIRLESIAEFVVTFPVENGGYGYLIGPVSDSDTDLRFLAYPVSKYRDIPLRELGPQYASLERQLLQGSEALNSVTLESILGGEVIAFYRKTFNGWYAGLAFPQKEYFRDVYTMSVIFSVIGVVMMIILCYFLLRLSLDKIHSDEENKAKSSFLAQVSHEIRTPLNSIMGMSEIILRKDIAPDLYEDVSIIKQAGNILLSIINNILDFSRIETNRVQMEVNSYNLASMINDVINIIRLRLMDKPVDFFVNIDSDIPAELIGDEVKIRQLLINLLNNAVKYTKLGYIKVSIKKDALPPSDAASGGGQVKIIFSIEDTGIGIKPGDMKYLFNDFTRLDLEHNHNVEGTGLGLTIAESFCKAMGGGITVESTYGKGSVFTAEIIQTCENPKKIAQLEDPSKRVLVYEDRPAYLQALLSAFSSLSLQPECAHGLAAFMDDIQGSSYDYAFIPSRHAADCISRWEKSGSPVKLIVMLNTDDMSSSRRVGSVHLPIYSCVLANILNGVTDKHLFHSNRIAFTAPAAKILVVDDLPTNLRVAEELMSPYNMKVDTCLSGSEALDLIQQNHYDLIFMDHMMPEMDGLMATDLIRKLGQETGEHDYYRNLPIIMLTANAVAGQREMFLKNGINEFLPKPIDVRKLNIVLETWIPQDKQRKGKVVQPEEDSGPFPAIPGVDTGVGLQNTGSSAGAYRRILSLFCGDVDERLPQIKKAAAEGDYPMYTTMVHAIKGAARSIGALAVGERAAELEAAGRGGDTALIAEKTGPLLEELAKLTGNIRAALGEQGNRAELLILADLKLEALKDALNAMDTAAVDAHLSGILARSLDQKTREYIGEIEQHILLFEYDKAVKMIDKVLSQSPLGEDHD